MTIALPKLNVRFSAQRHRVLMTTNGAKRPFNVTGASAKIGGEHLASLTVRFEAASSPHGPSPCGDDPRPGRGPHGEGLHLLCGDSSISNKPLCHTSLCLGAFLAANLFQWRQIVSHKRP